MSPIVSPLPASCVSIFLQKPKQSECWFWKTCSFCKILFHRIHTLDLQQTKWSFEHYQFSAFKSPLRSVWKILNYLPHIELAKQVLFWRTFVKIIFPMTNQLHKRWKIVFFSTCFTSTTAFFFPRPLPSIESDYGWVLGPPTQILGWGT